LSLSGFVLFWDAGLSFAFAPLYCAFVAPADPPSCAYAIGPDAKAAAIITSTSFFTATSVSTFRKRQQTHDVPGKTILILAAQCGHGARDDKKNSPIKSSYTQNPLNLCAIFPRLSPCSLHDSLAVLFWMANC